MSSDKQQSLIDAIGRLIMRWQDATQAFDEAVGAELDLGMAERHCFGLLYDGPKPAGAIAAALGLTPAAVTALIDRLETRGLVERRKSTADRRQVYVALTDKALKMSARYYGPIAREGVALLEKMSRAELEAVKAFLAETLDLQQRHTDRIRAKAAKPR